MKRTSFLVLSLVPAACSVPSADIMPRYGSFDVEGHFGITNSSLGAVPVADLEQAGFDKDDGYVGLRADFDFGSPVIYASAQSTSHGGAGILGNDLDSGVANQIPAGTAVTTDMDLGLYQLGVTFDLVPSDLIEIGIGLGVTAVDLDARMTDDAMPLPNVIDTERTLPIPVLALRAGLALGDFEASGLLTGLDLSIDGDRVSFLDLDLLARYRFLGGDDHLSGSIGIGYRALALGVEYEDDGDRIDTDFRFGGPYLTLVLTL
jgi:hypothetical protein